MSDPIIKAANLKKVYPFGKKHVSAVNGVDLNVKHDHSVTIVGPSGAGKSTLLHILGGLDRPTAGSVKIDGTDIYNLQDKDRAKIRNGLVGFIFQFYNLLPEFTALENVMLPAMIKRTTREERRVMRITAETMLKSVGLGDRMFHRPSELSGGESQRVAIARALINKPKILLCDEPTGNLDSKNSQAVYDLLFKIKAESGTTLIIVTHDESLSKMTDETIRMKDGKIV